MALEAFPVQRVGVGPIGQSVVSGEVACIDIPPSTSSNKVDGVPIVSIPLRVVDMPVGAIAVHKLLQQKTGFSALDHELFTLLAGHSATAIFASRLYALSERKLTTIQGFIDLLTE